MAEVLVFGNDTGACLGEIRSLGRRGIEVHAANSGRNEATVRSRYCAATHDLRRYGGSGREWLACARELVVRPGYALLAPTDYLAPFLAERHELLRHIADYLRKHRRRGWRRLALAP